jgi:hypothetical protein
MRCSRAVRALDLSAADQHQSDAPVDPAVQLDHTDRLPAISGSTNVSLRAVIIDSGVSTGLEILGGTQQAFAFRSRQWTTYMRRFTRSTASDQSCG